MVRCVKIPVADVGAVRGPEYEVVGLQVQFTPQRAHQGIRVCVGDAARVAVAHRQVHLNKTRDLK